MPRSETNYIIGKVTYADLNLTQYPNKIDSRAQADAGYNANMKGFENINDYNMAEHINAVSDAVMSIERALGTMPFVDKDGVNRGSVQNRINILENKDYDLRYGGSGWVLSQTLVGHTHTGEAGHASQINLVTETQGQLPKGKVNLTFGNVNAMTGADISVSSTDSRKIADAMNDKLSVAQGGTIQKSLEVKGSFLSRLYREWDATTMTGGALTTDYTVMTNQIRRAGGTGQTFILASEIRNLLYNKYVIGFRLRVNTLSTEEVFRTAFYNMNNSGGWVWQSGLSIKGSDFAAANQWQMFYQLIEHKGDRADAFGTLQVLKSATSIAIDLDIDNIIIMPTHPAIYDR